MSYAATVLKVMIASPGDVVTERTLIREVIHEWNATHSDQHKVVLLPVGWETHSAPEMGSRAQEIINKQILRDADILVAAFWTKLGTPTGSSPSGTAEEISEHIDAGKPALLYFSAAPVKLNEVDPAQYKALEDFRRACMQNGLIEQYESITEFHEKFRRQLATVVYRAFPNGAPDFASFEDPLLAPDDGLSSQAKELLLEAAADVQGIIMKLSFAGGSAVQTNQRNFVLRNDRRSEAQWRAAIGELEDLGYIEDRAGKGEVYVMTHSGYDAADRLGPLPLSSE
ncbi:hypothetical protein [Rhizobium leguminosarum]|uniref:hypothetical protein n=1 Tax=Rhizobium leguminosarum TaxID=384 RepID=UPI001C90E46F|nr:hypothetical protein [Rhizobium leguminosarum]MBY2910577.1 DUF4062 domain-containing protein [Rhizobium leguminosarum]MBY2950390.1 DUF4062 domain-containing protein [Rhizobium leguminosarum]